MGDRICSIPCCASCFAIVYLKENVEFILCSHITEEKQLGRQGIEQILSTKQLRWLLPYLLILSFFYAVPVSTGTVSATQPPWKVIMKFRTLQYYNRLKFCINFRWYFWVNLRKNGRIRVFEVQLDSDPKQRFLDPHKTKKWIST